MFLIPMGGWVVQMVLQTLRSAVKKIGRIKEKNSSPPKKENSCSIFNTFVLVYIDLATFLFQIKCISN